VRRGATRASTAAPTRWGWHQLADEWARQLVERGDVRPGDLVVDIGAGSGAITGHLVAAGARVVAVELHPRRAQELRTRFAGSDVIVVQADAADLRLPGQPFCVVANPPFAITTALLRRLLGPRSQLVRADLVVPRHVAIRWAAGRGSDSRRWVPVFDARMTQRVPRWAFSPPSPSDAAVLTIVRRPVATRRTAPRAARARPRPQRR
jgi:23S rRNA (adenine-N6)-dimethyltransferase